MVPNRNGQYYAIGYIWHTYLFLLFKAERKGSGK
jgi:hypothetical protein